MRTALTMMLLLAACGGGSGDRAPPARASEPAPVRDEGYEHALRGEAAFEEGRLDEAHAAYARALELWPPRHPYRALVAYKLAWTCYRLDRFPEALDRFAAVADAPARADLGEEAVLYLALIVAEVDWDGDMQDDARLGLDRPEVAAWLGRVAARPWFPAFDAALAQVCRDQVDERPCARSRER